jgi:hypothetical protein
VNALITPSAFRQKFSARPKEFVMNLCHPFFLLPGTLHGSTTLVRACGCEF